METIAINFPPNFSVVHNHQFFNFLNRMAEAVAKEQPVKIGYVQGFGMNDMYEQHIMLFEIHKKRWEDFRKAYTQGTHCIFTHISFQRGNRRYTTDDTLTLTVYLYESTRRLQAKRSSSTFSFDGMLKGLEEVQAEKYCTIQVSLSNNYCK